MLVLFIYTFLTYLAISSPIDAVTQDVYWRNYIPGDIPCDAYEGAPGRYIGQFLVRHGTSSYNLPATIYAHTNKAVAELSGKKTSTEDIKILCSPDNNKFYWEYVDFDKPEDIQLKNAVKGGHEGFISFIGKALHGEEWKIGKVTSFEDKGNRGLYVWNSEDKAVLLRQFFVLKFNTSEACLKYTNSKS